MRRFLGISLWLIACGICIAPAVAFWQSRDSGYNVSVGGAPGYTGPGDVISGAFGAWLLRCYNSAYVGNVADVYAPSDASHTLITCTSGGVLNETLQSLATTCATSCTVKTLYDQTAGAYGDMSEATEANRPTFNPTGLNGKYMMSFTPTQQLQTATGLASHNPPATFSFVARRPSTNSGKIFWTDGAFNMQMDGASSFNTFQILAGAALTATVSDTHFHPLQILFSGVLNTSNINVDGTDNIGNAGTQSPLFGDRLALNPAFTGAPGTFDFVEGIVWLADKSTSFGALNSNQTAYWGPF